MSQNPYIMNEDSKANLLISYRKDFGNIGFNYFHLDKRECYTLYIQKLDLFKEQLNQEITDKKTAKKMMRKLSQQILWYHKKQKEKPISWQITIIHFDEKDV